MKKAFVIVLLLACAGGAWWMQRGEARAEHAAVARVAAPSPVAEMIVAGLGGFRGIASEVIWFRADRLQSEGRYGELAQLATWLTYLEPHTPEVWAYTAWNLAFNVSVTMPTPADRWRWVSAGLRLLRDDGLSFNPGNPELYRELAWLFLFKMGGGLDKAADFYQSEWKKLIEAAQASGDWTSLKMEPQKMKAVDEAYGAQDWTHPYASALYWGREGLSVATKIEHRHELRQIIYQTLMLESRKDPSFAPATLRELEATYREYPHPGLLDLIGHFRQQYGL